MVSSKPAVDPEGRYSQKEAAELLGVARHTIRRYELSGDIVFQVRRAGKGKFTTGKQILRCWLATY